MQEQAKIERMLSLMKLLTSTVDYTIEEMADRLGMGTRTVYRYLTSFSDAGFIIQKTGKHRFRLCTESPFFKDISQLVHFSEEEAYMVNQLIDSIADTNLVKCNLKRKLASVYNFKSVADSIIDKSLNNNVHTLLDAIDGKCQVNLVDYSSSNTGRISTRLVEPFAFTTGYVHVWCYEPASRLNKMFRVSRIGKVEMLPVAWYHESKHRTAFIDIFRMSSTDGETFPVKLELNTRAKNLLVEEYLLAEKYLTRKGADCWLLDVEVSNYIGVGRFVLGLAGDIRIIDSPGLADYVREYAQKYLLPPTT